MIFRKVIEAGLLAVGLLSAVVGQSNSKPLPEPVFKELSRDDEIRLEQQRAVVAAAAKRDGAGKLTRSAADLPVLQKLIDDHVFQKSQAYELQCLGVAFGDVLASEFPVRWVMVTDEFGTDPTLRFKKTTLQINALTMISKRIQADQPVDVSKLLRTTREQLVNSEQKWR